MPAVLRLQKVSTASPLGALNRVGLVHGLHRIKMLSFPFLISLCSRDPQAKNTLCLLPTRPQSCIMVTALPVPFPFLTHLLSEVSFLLGLLTHQLAWREKVHQAAVSLVLPAGPAVALSLHFACWPGSCLVLPSLHPALYSPEKTHPLTS